MEHERKGMCSPPDSIPLLQMLVRLTNARKVVEVGVFTGKIHRQMDLIGVQSTATNLRQSHQNWCEPTL